MLERRELGEAGLAYVRERLASGSTLSGLLSDGLDLSAGHAWAYLPPAMTDEQAADFDEPGITRLATGKEPEAEIRPNGRWVAVYNLVEPLIAKHVLDFFTDEESGVSVWEDPMHSPGDRWVRENPEMPWHFLGEEVCYALAHPMANPAAVGKGLGVMEAWWGSPAILAAPPPEALRPVLTLRSRICGDDLRPLVEHCRLLFFEAYDREGYVCWSSKDVADAGDGADVGQPRAS